MLRSVDGLGGEHFAFGEADASPANVPISVAVENGADGPSATIPDAHLLFTAQFSRAGADLVLHGEDGKAVVVQDYFAADQRARLLSPDGAALSPDIVDALTGPQAPGQFAQAAATPPAAQAVGRVAVVTGDATIVRNGVAMAANAGDPILKGDVLQTVSGTIGVTFSDGSTLNLTANTRLVVNEFVYDPRGSANSQLLDLVQGSLTFISGEVAHTGNMSIGTPVATMGIRGTVGGVTTANDGTVNFYVSQSATGAVIINQQGQIIANVVQDGPLIIVRPVGPLQVIAEEVQKSPAQLATELAALQQIVNIQSVGQQIIQQYFQPDPNNQNPNPNPQSTDKPLTQIQIFQAPNSSTPPGNAGANGGAPPPFNAATITTTTPNADGTQTTQTQTVTFAPNVAPILNYFNLAVAEGGIKVLSGSDYQITDPDSSAFTFNVAAVIGGVFQIWKQGAALNSGFAALAATDGEGGFWTDATSFTATDIASGHVRFVHDGGNGAPGFSISVSDGIAVGQPITSTINYTAVNDAPVAPPMSITTDENGAPVTFDGLANASDAEDDLLHIDNVVLTITDAQGNALPQAVYLVSGNSVTVDPAQFNYLGAGEQAILVANYNVIDSHGASVATSATLTVNGVNDAPVAPPISVATDENGSPVTINGLANARDAEGDPLHIENAVLTATVQGQVLSQVAYTVSGNSITVDPAQFNYLGAGEQAILVANYNVIDSHGASVATSATLTVNGVNDAPALSLSTSEYVEDQFNSQAYSQNTGTVNWSTNWTETNDSDSDNTNNLPTGGDIRITTDPSGAQGNSVLKLSDLDTESDPQSSDMVQRTANLSGALSAMLTFDYRRDIPSGQSDDLFPVLISTDGVNFTQIGQVGATGTGSFVNGSYQQFSLDISAYISATTTVRFSVGDGVDDGDVVYVDNVKIAYSRSANYVENGAAVAITSGGAKITDVDNTHLQSATIALTNHQANDLLSANGQLPAGIVASNYNVTDGILTLTGNATLADYQAALHQIQYSNTGDNPGSADRIVNITVFDGSAGSNTATSTIHVTPVNDTPVIVQTAHPGPNYNENGAAIAIGPGLTLSDSDSAMLTGATVSISQNYVAGADVLYFVPQSGITGSYANGVLTLSGSATVAQYQDALNSTTFYTSGENPSVATRTISYQVDDGQGANHASNISTTAVSVTAINDAAVITGAATGTVTEDGTLTATGNLDSTDVDNTGDAWQAVSSATSTGIGYGTYTVTAAGVWSYTLNNSNASVQALNAGGTLTDTFNVLTVDGTARQVQITINGANDVVDDFVNSTSTTGALSVGGSATGNIEVASDQDWFAITLQANRTYWIDLEGSPTSQGTLTDTYLRGIYTSQGSLIGGTTDDDSGDGFNSRVTFVSSTAATYFISAGAFGFNTGTYRLSVTNLFDPVVIDLNGDGVRFSVNAAFDLDASGVVGQIAWVGPNDGLLVNDLNSSGAIENGHEVFSPWFGSGGFADALAALASLDSNNDGTIDARDSEFGQIKVWTDANSDGVTQGGELNSLAEVGIASIDLAAQSADTTIDGQQVFAQGHFTFQSGETGQYVAVNLSEQAAPMTVASADPIETGPNGDDTVAGTAYADTFVFKAGYGADTITNFSGRAGQGDVIALENFQFSTFAQLQSGGHIQDIDHGGGAHDTLIDLGHGDSITLEYVNAAELTAADFIFHPYAAIIA